MSRARWIVVAVVVVVVVAVSTVVFLRTDGSEGGEAREPEASASASASPSASPRPPAPTPRVDSPQQIEDRLAKLTARKVEKLAEQMRQPRPVRIVQLNMCLSGIAKCAGRATPGARVQEAVGVIRSQQADVAVVNEACSRDAAAIAEGTGLELTFSVVPLGGRSLPCRGGGDRGVYGNAVLTGAVVGVQERAYAAQADGEQRRSVCAVLDGLTVCGTHLSAVGGSAVARRANDRQCSELTSVVAQAAEFQPVVAAGDLNRRQACAPAGFTTVTDAGATQARGIQQVMVDGRLEVESVTTVRMRTTDHDALVVDAVQPPLLPPLP